MFEKFVRRGRLFGAHDIRKPQIEGECQVVRNIGKRRFDLSGSRMLGARDGESDVVGLLLLALIGIADEDIDVTAGDLCSGDIAV